MFYVAALGIIMAVVPWDRIDGKMSPFVQIFESTGVPIAAGILNFVCLTAVMSVYNSALYSNSRMLYSLAKQGNAPAYLGRVNKRGVPVAGVLTSAAVTIVAVVVVPRRQIRAAVRRRRLFVEVVARHDRLRHRRRQARAEAFA